MSNESEYFFFDTDQLAYSHKEDHVKRKVYQAGKALGVPDGKVLVIDMDTGDGELVEADEAGTRPKEPA